MERNNVRISFFNRLITACISALIIVVMACCAPVAILVFGRGHGVGIIDSYRTFHIWGTSVSVVAGVVGFALGADRTIILFSHFWGTGHSNSVRFTLFLWGALIGVGLISYWLLAPSGN
ncbi:hypothetical protein [Paraherbaspirillum soli]|uniref:Uncharacterized protein n=1 Tax=Paraherbaspirillum soli TaxID=631222 RepID=A0ABW0MAB2_9BURK